MAGRIIQVGASVATVSVVLLLGWAAVCIGHRDEDAFWLHCVMGILSGIVIAAVLFGAVRGSRD